MKYFVSWYIHNKAENRWDAQIVDQYDSIDTAKKNTSDNPQDNKSLNAPRLFPCSGLQFRFAGSP